MARMVASITGPVAGRTCGIRRLDRFRAVVVVVASTTAGCAPLDPFDTSASTTVVTAEFTDDFTAVDLAFLYDMTEHLRTGTAVAEAALASDEIVRLAEHTMKENESLIERMNDLLIRRGRPDTRSVLEPSEIDGLDTLSGRFGTDFDRRWIELTTRYNEDATAPAEAVRRDGTNRDIENLASGMIIDFGFGATTLNALESS